MTYGGREPRTGGIMIRLEDEASRKDAACSALYDGMHGTLQLRSQIERNYTRLTRSIHREC